MVTNNICINYFVNQTVILSQQSALGHAYTW